MPKGGGGVLEAEHTLLGQVRYDPRTRQEFLALARRMSS